MDFTGREIETREGRVRLQALRRAGGFTGRSTASGRCSSSTTATRSTTRDAPHTDEGRAAFAGFARAAGVAHFKGKGVIWELWNEPNISDVLEAGTQREDYVKLAEAVYPADEESRPGRAAPCAGAGRLGLQVSRRRVQAGAARSSGCGLGPPLRLRETRGCIQTTTETVRA